MSDTLKQDTAMLLILMDTNDAVNEAIRSSDPERSDSILEEMEKQGITGSERNLIERVWGIKKTGRSRYVQGWRPPTTQR